FLVAGQGLAYLARHAVVALADQGRRQHLGLRAQGVQSGVEPLAGAFAREHDQGGQVSEGVRDGGVREIVRRNVDRLHRRDGRPPRGADALLQFGQLRPQGGLVTHARRQSPQQASHFGYGLDEAEDVVDQQQDVLTGVIPEVLRHGQGRVPHAKPGAGWFVHLAEHEHRVVGHAGGGDIADQFLGFARALANPAEDRDAPMPASDVVDQLRDEHGLAHAGAAEQARLATAFERGEQVDGLDALEEDLGRRTLLGERYRRPVERAPLAAREILAGVDDFAEDVDDTAEEPFPDRYLERMPQVDDAGPAGQASRR